MIRLLLRFHFTKRLKPVNVTIQRKQGNWGRWTTSCHFTESWEYVDRLVCSVSACEDTGGPRFIKVTPAQEEIQHDKEGLLGHVVAKPHSTRLHAFKFHAKFESR